MSDTRENATENNRRQFEAALTAIGDYRLDRSGAGYADPRTDDAWLIWTAAQQPGAGAEAQRNAGMLYPREGNTPIADLLAQYAAECCDFSNREWVRRAALRYVETMPDSQVRCLLYALATEPAAGNDRAQDT